MKVLLMTDSLIPNRALMKISGYHKSLGNDVRMAKDVSAIDEPDVVYVSIVFRRNAPMAEQIRHRYPNSRVICGGVGLQLSSALPLEIERASSDLELYAIDYNVDYLNRGCPRRCPWCVVWKAEGERVIRVAEPAEVISCSKLLLLDAQFLMGNPYVDLNFFINNDIKVNFHQGLDIRCVTEELAQLLSETRFVNRGFKRRQIYFSFDNSAYEGEYRSGIETLERAGIKPRGVMTYFLGGFDNMTFENEVHRFNVIREVGADPYYMLFDGRDDDLRRLRFKRWVNRRVYKTEPRFENYWPMVDRAKAQPDEELVGESWIGDERA